MTRRYTERAADKYACHVRQNPYPLEPKGRPYMRDYDSPEGLKKYAYSKEQEELRAAWDYAYDLVARMVDGELETFKPPVPYTDGFMFASYARSFVTQWSWFLFTRSWIDALYNLVKGACVVEVFAGNGWVARLMQQRGVDWTATDLEPGNDWVLKMDAVDAVREFPSDIFFASWIPYESDLDYFIASLGKPMIIEGEGAWGCTGSEIFWEEYGAVPVGQVYPNFPPTPNWSGIHDSTWLVNWPATRAERVPGYGDLDADGQEMRDELKALSEMEPADLLQYLRALKDEDDA